MIVPQNKMIIRLAVFLIPLAVLMVVNPLWTVFLGIGAGVFAVIVLWDAVWALQKHFQLEITAPVKINMSVGKESEIKLTINFLQKQDKLVEKQTNTVSKKSLQAQNILREPTFKEKEKVLKGQIFRIGIPFNQSFDAKETGMLVEIPEQEKSLSISYQCIPNKRGLFNIENCYLESYSPFQFWAFRRKQPLHVEIHVYPNLMRQQRKMAAIFLSKHYAGFHVQRQIGKGREFEKLRDYISGDSYSDISWKITAKKGKPITKVYQIEKTQSIYVVLDSSRLSLRKVKSFENDKLHGEKNNFGEDRIIENYILAALLLALTAEKQGDKFGLIAFSDTTKKFLRARNGHQHFRIIRDVLSTLRAEEVTPDFVDVCSSIALRIRKRALILFLTNLDDPLLADKFSQAVRAISKRHLVSVVIIKPAAFRPLFSSADVVKTDDIYKQLAGHIMLQNLLELEKVLKHEGLQFSLVDNERLCTQLISNYLTIKQRQLL